MDEVKERIDTAAAVGLHGFRAALADMLAQEPCLLNAVLKQRTATITEEDIDILEQLRNRLRLLRMTMP